MTVPRSSIVHYIYRSHMTDADIADSADIILLHSAVNLLVKFASCVRSAPWLIGVRPTVQITVMKTANTDGIPDVTNGKDESRES